MNHRGISQSQMIGDIVIDHANNEMVVDSDHTTQNIQTTKPIIQVRRNVGLLHPDWRKFPHVQLYGWTAHHERQWKYLHNMIVKGALESAYYATEMQYKAASLSNQYTVLSRPIVSNVKEVIELLRRNQRFGNYSHSLAESAEYDADDESDEKPGVRCREQKYRRLETAV